MKELDKNGAIFVKISDYETTFWRYQQYNKKCLATSEAIYYFYKEYEMYINKTLKKNVDYAYDGIYDNLMFYYILQFEVIVQKIDKKKKKAAVVRLFYFKSN